MVGWTDVVAPRGAVLLGFVVVLGLFVGDDEGREADLEPEGEGEREAEAEGEGEGVTDGWGVGDGAGTCGGIRIGGASAWTPTRLLAMATARTAPTRETGHPSPRSSRPRMPDWLTNTGAGAGSSTLDSCMSG